MTEPDAERYAPPPAPRRRRAGAGLLAILGVIAAFGSGVAVAWQMNGSAPWQGEAAAAAADAGRNRAVPVRVAQAPAPAPAQTDAAASTAPAAPAAADAPDGDTPFAEHARRAGANACAGLYATLGLNLTGGSRYSLRSSWDGSAPDRRPIEGVVGLVYDTEGYAGTAAGYVLASPDGSSCGGTMVRVAAFEASCDAVRATLPPGSTPVDGIAALPVFEQPDGGKIFLLPVNAGCAVVSTLAGIASPQPQESAR